MNNFYCQICKKETIYDLPNMFTKHHLKKIHPEIKSLREYYDLYIRKSNEGICKLCGNKIILKDNLFYWNKKYTNVLYCSKKCSMQDLNKSDKHKKQVKDWYTNENNMKKHLEKIKQGLIKNIGTEYTYHNPKIKNKMLQSKNRYYYNKYQNLIGNKYQIIKYIGNLGKIIIKCLECNKEFEMQTQMVRIRLNNNEKLCLYCNPFIKTFSYGEKQLVEFIKENYTGNIIENDRTVIFPNELDIYLPDKKLAFEFNGLYFHNELFCSPNYHLIKTKQCEEKGIHLIHIYEDDWIYKQNIVKSRILNLLGKSKIIYGRNCEIKNNISFNETKDFLNNNHIQGWCVSKYNYGLYYENELVAIMTFGKLRHNLGQTNEQGTFELLRFSNKQGYSIIGGAEKLFKYFIEDIKPKKIISYADRSWTKKDDNIYIKLGFIFEKETKPNYWYIKKDKRLNRYIFRKSQLIKMGYDKEKSEKEIMFLEKIYRIYDSGNLKYKYLCNKEIND